MRTTERFGGIGRLVNLNPINFTITNTDTTTNIKRKTPPPKMRTMKISEQVHELLRNHSRKYHNQPISYNEIIEELCKFYNEHHDQKYWF